LRSVLEHFPEQSDKRTTQTTKNNISSIRRNFSQQCVSAVGLLVPLGYEAYFCAGNSIWWCHVLLTPLIVYKEIAGGLPEKHILALWTKSR